MQYGKGISRQSRSLALLICLIGLWTAVARLQAQGPPATPVRYTLAQEHALRRSVVLTGSVESRRHSIVATEVEGVVQSLVAREGDHVEAGQPLVRLRRDNLSLRLEAVRGQLKEAQARQHLAATSLDRARDLFAEKIISQQQLDDASSEQDAWQGRTEQLQAEVSRLEDNLARATVRAPFSGSLVQELVAPGEWVSEGGAIVELVDTSDLEVTIEVPESAYAGLAVGLAADVVIASLDDLTVEGAIRAIIPRADSKARTFPVKVSLPNQDRRFAVGMLARVHLPVGQPIASVIVPKDAVVSQGNESVVFRVNGDETVERLRIDVGTPTGLWVAVRGEVQPGDQIVTRGNERVFPGQKVVPEALEYPAP